MSISSILEILDRAHKGPVCTLKEWNVRVIPTTVSRMLRKYSLSGTCDPENPINTDDELADSFFKAGFELAVEMGFLCQDTERVIKITEEELSDVLEFSPNELSLGDGHDKVLLRHRKPEDKRPPLMCSPTAVVFLEDIWVKFHQALAQCREIDIMSGGSIITIFGHRVLAGTPYETLLGRFQAQLTREALWRAGRPGMSTIGVTSSPTQYGQLGGFGTVGGFEPTTSIAMILLPGEMLTSYAGLHKVCNAINCGAIMNVTSEPMIGSYSGPPEGAVLTMIAGNLLNRAIHQAHICGGAAIDIRYFGNCGREGQWVHSVVTQAISRNTHLLNLYMQHQVAGPCTEMLLYEDAVSMMQLSASGAEGAKATRSSGSRYFDHLTPLECKFSAEVLKRSAGMTRKEVNEIAKILIPKYEDNLKSPPKGKSFRECFDLETLKPTQEYLDIYLKVKKELIELGVPLDHP